MNGGNGTQTWHDVDVGELRGDNKNQKNYHTV